MGKLFGGKSKEAPQPDPRIGQAAEQVAALGKEYLDFAKEQFAVSADMQKGLQKIAGKVSDFFMGMAKEDRQRWESVFKPLQDRFIQEAEQWDSPERQAEAAAKAKADVHSAMASERGAAERRLSSMGVAPDSGRFAGMDRALGLGTTLAGVGAQNEARDRLREQGIGLRTAAINMGSGLTQQAQQSAGAAIPAAATPVQMHQQSTGIVQPGFNAAISGQQGFMQGMLGMHSAQMAAHDSDQKMKAANAAGFGQAIGTGLGLIFSSKKGKKNRKNLKDGTALAAVEQMPVQEFDYKPGVGDGGHHVGPMAEDFAAATGHGDGTAIPVQDAIGVTMGAVRDLAKKVDRMAEKIELGLPRPKAA